MLAPLTLLGLLIVSILRVLGVTGSRRFTKTAMAIMSMSSPHFIHRLLILPAKSSAACRRMGFGAPDISSAAELRVRRDSSFASEAWAGGL